MPPFTPPVMRDKKFSQEGVSGVNVKGDIAPVKACCRERGGNESLSFCLFSPLQSRGFRVMLAVLKIS